jgi:hypothetical protein
MVKRCPQAQNKQLSRVLRFSLREEKEVVMPWGGAVT